MEKNDLTIKQGTQKFLNNIELSRSENTARTYSNGLNAYMEMLEDAGIDCESEISIITEEHVSSFSKYLKNYSPTTESLYINVFKNFLEYLVAENILNLNNLFG